MTDKRFVQPDDDTLYIGLGGTAIFSYGDMIEEIGAEQAPTNQTELDTLLWSFDATPLQEPGE